MDDSMSSAALQVAKLITETLAAIAAHGEAKPPEGAERKTDLFFPDGIADIHVKLSAPGGGSVEIGIASSVAKVSAGAGEVPGGVRASAHPMFIRNEGLDSVWAQFALTKTGKFSDPVEIAKGDTMLPDIPQPPKPPIDFR